MKLIAKRNMRYMTRMLRAGDPFVAPDSDARVLIAVGRANKDEGEPVVDPESEIRQLRAQYQQKFGRRPWMAWDESKIRAKLAE